MYLNDLELENIKIFIQYRLDITCTVDFESESGDFDHPDLLFLTDPDFDIEP